MTRIARVLYKRNSRAGSFVAGLGALVSIWPNMPPPRYPHASAAEALRGDVARIGNDMRRVIKDKRARLKAGEE